MLGIVAAVGRITFGIFAWANHTSQEAPDWPPLTMTYNVQFMVSGEPIDQVRKLTYNSRTSWIEEVIEADDITVRVSTFNDTGSYQKLEGHVYTTYDAITGEMLNETVGDGVTMIPRGGLRPLPIAIAERSLGKEAKQVSTETKVCFNDECTELASGWELSDGKSTVVFADDVRGIPVKIGGFVVTELRVLGAQRPVVGETRGPH